jgi:hypothetical protein
MRQTGYAIDWTASLELEDNKKQDPWIILNKMRPDKDRPSTRLANYAGTKYDIFTLYLSRKGIDLGTRVNAYASGHSKVIECQGVLYLTTIDGTVYERNKPEGFNIKKELRSISNA